MLLYDANGSLSNVAPISTGVYAIAAVVSGAIADSIVASLFDVRIGATKPVAVEAGGLLVLSGGVPSAYDGATVCELGMAWEPDIARKGTPTAIAGGSLTASSVYRYLLVYEWRFANGAVVRSIPSYPYAFDADDLSTLITITTTGVNKTGSFDIPVLNLTNKQAFDSYANAVQVIVYRTLAGGSTFYRLTSVQVPKLNLGRPIDTTWAFTDTLADTTLQTRPLLYTDGGALPSELPPSAAHVAVMGNRVWLSGTDDDTIWISHELVEGEAPTFSGSLTIAPFEGGRVVGCAAMDEKRIILKAGSLYYVIGDGPGIDGLNGSFSKPVRVQSLVGCTDARSIVSTPAGVYFLSQNGLALIGRDLSVTLVGKAVADTVSSNGVVAATVIADQELVRFVVEGTMRTVEASLLFGGEWGTNVYVDPASGGSPTIVSSAYCRGSWFFLTSEGFVFQEVKTDWRDVNGASSRYVPSRIRLQYVSLSGIQGYQRVWWVSADGEKKSNHDLTMNLYVDAEASTSQTWTWSATDINAWGRYQAQVHVVHQECEAISVELVDATPTGASVGTGQGFTLFGVSMEIGRDRGLRRVPAAQSA